MSALRSWSLFIDIALSGIALGSCLGFVGCGSRVSDEEKVTCRSPSGKIIAKLEEWKFARIRQAILDTLPADGSALDFAEVSSGVAARIPEKEAKRIGKIPWFVETVSLEMEVRKELQKVKHAGKTKRIRRLI